MIRVWHATRGKNHKRLLFNLSQAVADSHLRFTQNENRGIPCSSWRKIESISILDLRRKVEFQRTAC
jgi:hypothetical protein